MRTSLGDMTDLDLSRTTATSTTRSPERRTLVVLAAIYLVGFVAMMATGTDREPDEDPAKIISGWGPSAGETRLQVFALMALCGVLVLYGAALRSALAQRAHRWTADAVLAGFSLLAVAYAGFGVSTMMLQHAVDQKDETLVAVANLLDTSNFLPAMPAMMAILLGAGLTALKTKALPTWLAWASIVLGLLAPAGPGGFAPFMLLPVWAVVVAATVKLDSDD